MLYREHDVPPEFVRWAHANVIPGLDLGSSTRWLHAKQQTAVQIAFNLVHAGLVRWTVADSRDNSKYAMRIAVFDAFIRAGYCKACLGSQSSGRWTRYAAEPKLLGMRKMWESQMLNPMTTKGVTTPPLVAVRTSNRHPANNQTPVPPGTRAKIRWLAKHNFIRPEIAGNRIAALGGLRKRKDDPQARAALANIRTWVRDRVRRCAGEQLPPDDRRREFTPEEWCERFEGVHANDHLRRMVELEQRINRVNEINLGHSWRAKTADRNGRAVTFQPSVTLRLIYNGRAFHGGGRLYTWHAGDLPTSAQNLSRAQRATLRIDGKRTAELDFASCQIRLAYHTRGLDPQDADLYRPARVFPRFLSYRNANRTKRKTVRDLVKRATLTALNADSRHSARSAVVAAIREADGWLQSVVRTETRKKSAVKQADEILRRIDAAHPHVASAFYSTQRGLSLMLVEGAVMMEILERCADRGIPVLPIHDAIRVRRSDARIAERIMTAAYRHHLGFDPVVKPGLAGS